MLSKSQIESLGKYIADLCRTLGVNISLVALLGLALGRAEVEGKSSMVIVLIAISGYLIIIGVIVQVISVQDGES